MHKHSETGMKGLMTHPVAELPLLLAAIDVALASDLGADVARAAVFDADGTLWRGDIGDTAFAAACDAGFVDDVTYQGHVRPWAASFGIDLSSETRVGMATLVDPAIHSRFKASAVARGLAETGYRRDFFAMQAWVYAGQKRDDIEAFGERLFAAGFERQIFEQMRELVVALKHRQVDVFIASASHIALVWPGAKRLGIPRDHVMGMSPSLDAKQRQLPELPVTTYGPDKAAVTFGRLQLRRPLLAFGDSVLGTDRELLALSVAPVAVATQGLHRAAAIACPRMLVFDPR